MPKLTLTRAEKKAGLDLRDVLGPRERAERKKESARGAKAWQREAGAALKRDAYINRVREALVLRISDKLKPIDHVLALEALLADLNNMLEDACKRARSR